MYADTAHIQFMRGRNRALPHNGGDDRYSCQFRQFLHLLICPADVHTAAQQKERSVCIVQQFRCFYKPFVSPVMSEILSFVSVSETFFPASVSVSASPVSGFGISLPFPGSITSSSNSGSGNFSPFPA